MRNFQNIAFSWFLGAILFLGGCSPMGGLELPIGCFLFDWGEPSKQCIQFRRYKPKPPCVRIVVPTPQISTSQNEKINASIGIYYSNKFKRGTEPLRRYPDTCYDVGFPSFEVFDKVFSQTFEKTSQVRLVDFYNVDSRNSFNKKKLEFNGVIEPRVHSLDLDFTSSSITYQFILFSIKGELISSFFVTGKALSNMANLKLDTHEYQQRSPETIEKAIKNAAENFHPTFLEQKEVQRWLDQIRNK